jgi:23S rRNA pseudoU1915 N3-methylase RlmH
MEAETNLIATDLHAQRMSGKEAVGFLVGGPIGMLLVARNQNKKHGVA